MNDRPDQPDVPEQDPTPPDDAAGDPADAPAPDESLADQQAPPEPLTCGECHAPLEADQTYCLNCGAPTALAPGLRRRGGFGALAVGLAALGVGAGVLGVAVANDDGSAPPATSTAVIAITTSATTGPLPPDTIGTVPPLVTTTDPPPFVTSTSGEVPPPVTTFETAPPVTVDTGSTETIPPATTTATDPFTDTQTDGGLPPDTSSGVPPDSEWPLGTSAWTAILASARDGDAARRARSRAISAGYGAHILVSDDHPNLTPGYYVVYVGVFTERSDAAGLAIRARASFPGAYPRYVSS